LKGKKILNGRRGKIGEGCKGEKIKNGRRVKKGKVVR